MLPIRLADGPRWRNLGLRPLDCTLNRSSLGSIVEVQFMDLVVRMAPVMRGDANPATPCSIRIGLGVARHVPRSGPVLDFHVDLRNRKTLARIGERAAYSAGIPLQQLDRGLRTPNGLGLQLLAAVPVAETVLRQIRSGWL